VVDVRFDDPNDELLALDNSAAPDVAFGEVDAINGSNGQCAPANGHQGPPSRKRGTKRPAKNKSTHAVQDNELNFTDVGNGRRFAIQHRDKFRFCHEQDEWYWWSLNRWRPDTRGNAMRAAKDTVRRMYADAAKLTDHGKRLAMIEHARESENVSRIKAMLTLAPSEDPFPVSPDEFDADPWLFNTLTGTVDLRTGKVSEPCREDLITKLAPVKWEPDATAENWLAFINLIFQGNANLITFTKRLLGYCLSGSTREQILPIFHGKGANGKSTLVGAIENVMGDYAMTAPDGMLTVHRHEPHPTQLADLHGKRFVVATETEDGNAFAESLVKQLTGSDRIRARRMRENFWEFTPRHKIILQTNHRPKITGTDHAIWRRIRLVPFDYTIPENLRDKDFPKKLQAESSGILQWLVQGGLEWQREGLTTPPEVQTATDEYRLAEDVLGGFLATCCTCRSFDKAGSSALFEAFKDYSGDREVSAVKFSAMMEQRGFAKYRITAGAHRGKMGWEGVGLLVDSCDTSADGFEPTAAETGF